MTGRQDDELSLLDIGVVVAESWKLLLIVSLLVGLVAFGISFAARSTFAGQASKATVLLSVSAYNIETLKTAQVLRAPMTDGGWLAAAGGDLETAWTSLAEALTARRSGDARSSIYRLELKHRSPEVALRTLSAIVAQLEAQRASMPFGYLTPPVEVLKAPELASAGTPPWRPALLTALFVAVATLVLMLLVVLVRDGWRRAELSAASQEKLARIRRAFGRQR